MKKILKTILVVLLIILIIIQFIKPKKNTDKEIASQQITANYSIPADVMKNLKVSCYDCHSNTTIYPYYWHFQPVAWFLNNHILEGKRHLNFSIFSTYPLWKQYSSFKNIAKEIKSHDMPLTSYTLIHRDAVLSADENVAIQNWAGAQMKKMEAQYPADSLINPRKRQ